MQLSKGQEGIAMLVTLAFLVVVAGVAALMFSRTMTNLKHSADDTGIIQSLLVGQGGANLGGALLQGEVQSALREIVEYTSDVSGRWAYGSGPDDAPRPQSVVDELSGAGAGSSVAERLQREIDRMLCGKSLTLAGGASASLRLYFTESACGQDLPGSVRLPAGRYVSGEPRKPTNDDVIQTYALPFVLVSEGALGDYRRNVVMQGEYQFPVGRRSFATYALFTNAHRTERGSEVWFTDDTLFDGPVHTNEYFRFYRNPWFGDQVTSAGCDRPGDTSCRGSFRRQGAEFYGEGFIGYQHMNSQTSPSYTNRYGTHAPELAGGVNWASNFTPLPDNSFNQKDAALDEGLHLSGDLYSLNLWAADASGDPVAGDGGPPAKYQYIESCRSEDDCDLYRYGDDEVLQVRDSRTGKWSSLGSSFNGVVFVEGEVERLQGPQRSPASDDPNDARPAIASFAGITLTATKEVRVTGDLTYEIPPCSGTPERNEDGTVSSGTCENEGARNVLGVYAPNSDILIGNGNREESLNAPYDVTVHGVLMSGRGEVGVENYARGSARGSLNLLGGIIEYYYGAFGTFNSRTGVHSSGYSRSFTYDRRMAEGFAPPFFPTVEGDTVGDPVIFSFGQREQIF